ESFSPTDLLATSLGTCLLTIMAIKAKSKGFDLKGIYLNIEKVMTQNSARKIKELIINIFIPESTSNETIEFLKKASQECPVTRNLSQEIDIKISWHNE
ncbi:OsmC family protein, partial [Prochlorococcus marinus]